MKDYILQRIALLKEENNIVQFPIERVVNEKFNPPFMTKGERKIEEGRQLYFDYWRGSNDEEV